MKKKIINLFFIITIIIGFCFNASYASQLVEGTLVTVPSEINSPDINDLEILTDHVLMMERSTGNILYDKNGNEKMYPASTTKILTGILVLENCSLNETAEVTSLALKAVPSGYATCDIQIGEKFTVKDLLYTMLIRSANDAANVLAIHVSGSISGFANLMNDKAKEIGCTSSHFTNPSGVHEEDHYSTARDLALIADYAMNNASFRDIVATSSYSLPATDKYPHDNRTFTTSNNLINPDDKKYYYYLATGIKTGYTNASKDCIVASAKKDGIEFIVVVLGADSSNGVRQKYLDCKTLFDFAFDNYITYYKELQAKRESKFNPFTQLYNYITGQNEEENQNQVKNIVSKAELEVTADPIESEVDQMPNFENTENNFSPLIVVVIILVFIIMVFVVLSFIFMKKFNKKNTRSRRRIR